MPALDNPKHEALVQTLAKQLKDPTVRPSQTKAYQQVYGLENAESARAAAPRVLADVSVKNRLIELLERDETTSDVGIQRKLAQLMETAKDGVQLGAVQTIMKVKGQLSDGANSLQQNNIAQVTFNLIAVSPATAEQKP